MAADSLAGRRKRSKRTVISMSMRAGSGNQRRADLHSTSMEPGDQDADEMPVLKMPRGRKRGKR